MPRFMITVRSVSGDAFGGAIGAIRYLVVPDNVPPAPSHAVARTDWIKQVMQTFTRDARKRGRQPGVPGARVQYGRD